MKDTLLEQILYQPINKSGSRRIIEGYTTGTIALFTPFDPPKLSVPIIGIGTNVCSGIAQMEEFRRKEIESFTPSREPIGLSVTPTSTKLFGPEIESPLMRIDRKAHHGLPEHHLQFGAHDYTGRYGEEAYDIYADVFKNTRRNILFPFDEEKKPWEL